MEKAKIVASPAEGKGRPNVFGVKAAGEKRVYTFQAPSEAEHDLWVSVLKRMIGEAHDEAVAGERKRHIDDDGAVCGMSVCTVNTPGTLSFIPQMRKCGTLRCLIKT